MVLHGFSSALPFIFVSWGGGGSSCVGAAVSPLVNFRRVLATHARPFFARNILLTFAAVNYHARQLCEKTSLHFDTQRFELPTYTVKVYRGISLSAGATDVTVAHVEGKLANGMAPVGVL